MARWRFAESPSLRARKPPPRAATVMFGFSGHLDNPIGSGTDLYHQQPAFRHSVDTVSALMVPATGLHIAEAFDNPASESATRLAEQYFGERRYQAVFQIGVIDTWSALGLRPGAVIGLCLGEFVGAYAAGVLDRRGAARCLDAMFGHLEAARIPGGVLWMVDASRDELAPVLADAPATTQLVGMMASREAVIVCAGADADRVRDHLDRTVTVLSEHPDADVAWHTPMPPQASAAFLHDLADLTCRPAACPFYASSLAGARIDRGVTPDPSFFTRIVQIAAAFELCAAAAIADGHRRVLTVGSPTIRRLVNCSLGPEARSDLRVIDTYQRDEPAIDGLRRAQRELQALGALP